MEGHLLDEAGLTDLWDRLAPSDEMWWLSRLDAFAPVFAKEVGHKIAIRSLRALSDQSGMETRYAPWSGLGQFSWGFVLQALAYRIHKDQTLALEGPPERASSQQLFLVVWEAARWENHGYPPEEALLAAGLNLVGQESVTS